ncbi:hypothetical protein [Gluconobacter cerinus]|uniref:hypothetical protein n=1 Tax=Gluconobacter cerinus TaxID=38307 RepID=UPI0012ED1731|nr:hypothetical protein [Gluconobacter cerinus]
MRRLLNPPGQSCGLSREARSTTAASHPAFSLTVAVPVRKATARPSAAGVRPASAAGPHATPHQPQTCPLARDAPGLTACPVARLGRWQDGLRKTPPSFHSRRRQCARRTGRMGLGKRQVFTK